jgi:3-methylcrotonyl-CoA carboxylase beta subunit
MAAAQVPKVTLLVGGSFGAGNYGMCWPRLFPALLFTWRTPAFVMGGERRRACLHRAARHIEAEGKEWGRGRGRKPQGSIRAKYEERLALLRTARLWDDGILLPSETRRVLALAFSAPLNALLCRDQVRRVPDVG